MARQISADEQTFALRMVPHLDCGLSFADAAKAVLEDDARLLGAFFDRRSTHYVPTADERGFSHTTLVGKGDVIASEISRRVYNQLRNMEADHG